MLIFFLFFFGNMLDKFVSCLRHLYEDMGKDGIAKPVQSENFEIIHPSKTRKKMYGRFLGFFVICNLSV